MKLDTRMSVDMPHDSRSLSGRGWRLWVDSAAEYERDRLHLPGTFRIDELPVHPPSCGWSGLDANRGLAVSVPANVEEYLGDGRNNGTFRGVCWFWRDVEIPSEWAGRLVRICFEKARLRTEVFVNERLVGYDVIAETPFSIDVSGALKYGAENRIAVRITNVGGNRGWEDYWFVRWDDQVLPNSHDYTGLCGDVTLEVMNPLHIEDLFIRNELPAGGRNLTLVVRVEGIRPDTDNLRFHLVVSSVDGGADIYRETWTEGVPEQAWERGERSGGVTLAHSISVPAARLWSLEQPVLYRAVLEILGDTPERTNSPDNILDRFVARFGFRTVEVRPEAGRPNLFLNGVRIRHRSAIDWGYYSDGGNYATPEQALKSVLAARAAGHNGINFHRRLGEPRVLECADALGLYLYEEPGAFHFQQGEDLSTTALGLAFMREKIRRMVRRDRNHPSLLWYSLANEDNAWNPHREEALRDIHREDGTRLVINSSHSHDGKDIAHLRPYENEIRHDFFDHHEVENTARFDDHKVFTSHMVEDWSRLRYWGESGCYTGPSNWVATGHDQQRNLPDRLGYDNRIYQPLCNLLSDYHRRMRPDCFGSRMAAVPEDLSRQAARGLMYMDGRLGQQIQLSDHSDGYAINGWSNGPMCPDEWDSALCDEARNLKGPAGDMAYWNRPVQVAIRRRDGVREVRAGQTAAFRIDLLHEGVIPAGAYRLRFRLRDGDGRCRNLEDTLDVAIVGGSVYSQKIADRFDVTMPDWMKAGHATLEARLEDREGQILAEGGEQVLLRNRASYRPDLAGAAGAVTGWEAARAALSEAGLDLPDFRTGLARLDMILMGDLPSPEILEDAIRRVREDGSTLLVRFNPAWGNELARLGLLEQAPDAWDCPQSDGWKGNGWGYLDYLVGTEALPSGGTIGTTGWEVPTDPTGFSPFTSRFPTASFGAWMARHTHLRTLIGLIRIGNGVLLLDAAYPVDQDTGLSDLLFFRMVRCAIRGEWAAPRIDLPERMDRPTFLLPGSVLTISVQDAPSGSSAWISFDGDDERIGPIPCPLVIPKDCRPGRHRIDVRIRETPDGPALARRSMVFEVPEKAASNDGPDPCEAFPVLHVDPPSFGKTVPAGDLPISGTIDRTAILEARVSDDDGTCLWSREQVVFGGIPWTILVRVPSCGPHRIALQARTLAGRSSSTVEVPVHTTWEVGSWYGTPGLSLENERIVVIRGLAPGLVADRILMELHAMADGIVEVLRLDPNGRTAERIGSSTVRAVSYAANLQSVVTDTDPAPQPTPVTEVILPTPLAGCDGIGIRFRPASRQSVSAWLGRMKFDRTILRRSDP